MRTANDGMTPAEIKVLADIDENGVHIVHVAESARGPGYSYTIGMPYSFDHAEVIVFGLPPDVAEALLDAVADEAADGNKFAADGQHDGLLQGYPVKFFAVAKGWYPEFLETALWAHEGDGFDCVQLVWPDKQGRWPWRDDVREGFAEMQPVLGRREPPA
ncbi:MAG: DUF4262 domain-containing protein [Planctomycetes bacterium]|nr:DUF4262 domain-containing protein [Planctomycetota bacterium]MCB9884134.1 DUF4262 domain-containing protein [Planctomycetota bacterium]